MRSMGRERERERDGVTALNFEVNSLVRALNAKTVSFRLQIASFGLMWSSPHPDK